MNVYFEFPKHQVGKRYAILGATIPAKYCVRYCATDLPGGPLVPWRLVPVADRVWQEDETGVKFLKNRYSNPETTPIDYKELMWVKLSAVTI